MSPVTATWTPRIGPDRLPAALESAVGFVARPEGTSAAGRVDFLARDLKNGKPSARESTDVGPADLSVL
jgi:hypothetical protein